MSLKSLVLDLIRWDNLGTNPLSDRKDTGRAVLERIPAGEYNWFKNQFYTFLSTITNALRNSFSADLAAYYGNTGAQLNTGQSASLWSLGADDTIDFKLGDQSVAFTTINGTILPGVDNIPTTDYSVLNNGDIISDDDYYTFLIGVDDYTLITTYQIRLSSDAIHDNVNYIRANMIPTKNGFELFKIKKSDLIVQGTGANLSDIQSIVLRVVATGVTNVNWQYDQPVKKDPTLPIPNPFQKNGVADFIIDNSEWFVGKEFSAITVKELTTALTNLNALKSTLTYADFVATLKVRGDSDTSVGTLGWWKDSDNFISARISGDDLELVVEEGGVPTELNESLPISAGDEVELELIKQGSTVTVTAYLNKDRNSPVIINTTTSLTGEGSLVIGTLITVLTNYEGISITEIPHSHHSNISEVSKSLVEQPRARVYNSATQSIGDSAATALTFDSVRYDNNVFFDIDDPNRLTIRTKGLYLITGHIEFETNVTGYREVRIHESISNTIYARQRSGTTIPAELSIATSIELNVGDEIQLVAFQNSGVPLNVNNTEAYSSELSIAKLV